MSTFYYTTRGSVRGYCGHKHRTISGACRCMIQDQRGCQSQRGYSDRSVVLYVNGEQQELSEGDFAAVWDTLDKIRNGLAR